MGLTQCVDISSDSFSKRQRASSPQSGTPAAQRNRRILNSGTALGTEAADGQSVLQRRENDVVAEVALIASSGKSVNGMISVLGILPLPQWHVWVAVRSAFTVSVQT